jgi:lipid-binding SYLF domain-containing protein
MKKFNLPVIFVAIVSLFLLTGLFGGKKTAEEQRQEILEMRQKTLGSLYKQVPGAEKEIDKSLGYAVFSNTGINILLVSTANGAGVAHNKNTGEDIFMKMFSAGGGVGMGVKDFRGIFIFTTQEAYDVFVSEGWQAGAQVDAAAKSDEGGDAATMAIDVGPGIKLYQITEKGVALQATIQGTKYWKDTDLNN